jgi:hypothetical protein
MSLTTLCVPLLALLCLANPNANARAPYAQDSTAKPSQESKQPLASEDVGSAKAEELCVRGEALSKQGDSHDALKLLKESVNLYRQSYLGARAPVHTSAPESATSFRTMMAARLRRAPQCMELYARLGGPEGATVFERQQLDARYAHAVGLTESDASRAVFFGQETDEKAVITHNPPPAFPRGARRGVGYGKVRLRVILGADGEIRHILVLSGQPNGLSEASVESAKNIRFKPAVKSGRPVSQFVTVEHSYQTF